MEILDKLREFLVSPQVAWIPIGVYVLTWLAIFLKDKGEISKTKFGAYKFVITRLFLFPFLLIITALIPQIYIGIGIWFILGILIFKNNPEDSSADGLVPVMVIGFTLLMTAFVAVTKYLL